MNSMDNFRPPFKNWSSKAGLKSLDRLFRKDVSLPEFEKELNLSYWVVDLIHLALLRFRKQVGKNATTRQRRHAILQLADELDVFGMDEEPSKDILERLESNSFKGKRSHLVRLLASVVVSYDWDHWRKRSGEEPDLRGANLNGLELGSINLSHARLRGANLSAATIRVGDLRHADLRDCELWDTDLSYADLREAKLIGANLNYTLLSEADLRGADLRRSFLIGTSMNQARLEGTKLRGAVAWGISVRDIKCDDSTQQKGLLVPRYFEPIEFAISDDRTKDYQDLQDPENSILVNHIKIVPFIVLLIENPMMGPVIDAASDTIVLLLGRFTRREKGVLDALKRELPSFGYVPMVFDFKEPKNRDTIETVAILAGLSKFVIANLSKPQSTPLESHLIIPSIAVPFVPIIREKERKFSMFKALQRKYPWVLKEVPYSDEADLIDKLKTEVINPAEKAAAMLRQSKHPKEDND